MSGSILTLPEPKDKSWYLWRFACNSLFNVQESIPHVLLFQYSMLSWMEKCLAPCFDPCYGFLLWFASQYSLLVPQGVFLLLTAAFWQLTFINNTVVLETFHLPMRIFKWLLSMWWESWARSSLNTHWLIRQFGYGRLHAEHHLRSLRVSMKERSWEIWLPAALIWFRGKKSRKLPIMVFCQEQEKKKIKWELVWEVV